MMEHATSPMHGDYCFWRLKRWCTESFWISEKGKKIKGVVICGMWKVCMKYHSTMSKMRTQICLTAQWHAHTSCTMGRLLPHANTINGEWGVQTAPTTSCLKMMHFRPRVRRGAVRYSQLRKISDSSAHAWLKLHRVRGTHLYFPMQLEQVNLLSVVMDCSLVIHMDASNSSCM